MLPLRSPRGLRLRIRPPADLRSASHGHCKPASNGVGEYSPSEEATGATPAAGPLEHSSDSVLRSICFRGGLRKAARRRARGRTFPRDGPTVSRTRGATARAVQAGELAADCILVGRSATIGRAEPAGNLLVALQMRLFWAVSSVGRAPARQAGGHWFEPSTAHHRNPLETAGFSLSGVRLRSPKRRCGRIVVGFGQSRRSR